MGTAVREGQEDGLARSHGCSPGRLADQPTVELLYRYSVLHLRFGDFSQPAQLHPARGPGETGSSEVRQYRTQRALLRSIGLRFGDPAPLWDRRVQVFT